MRICMFHEYIYAYTDPEWVSVSREMIGTAARLTSATSQRPQMSMVSTRGCLKAWLIVCPKKYTGVQLRLQIYMLSCFLAAFDHVSTAPFAHLHLLIYEAGLNVSHRSPVWRSQEFQSSDLNAPVGARGKRRSEKPAHSPLRTLRGSDAHGKSD